MSPRAERRFGKVCLLTETAGAFAGDVADRLTRESVTVVGVDRREHAVPR